VVRFAAPDPVQNHAVLPLRDVQVENDNKPGRIRPRWSDQR